MRGDLYLQLLGEVEDTGSGEGDDAESVRVISSVTPACSASSLRRSVFFMMTRSTCEESSRGDSRRGEDRGGPGRLCLEHTYQGVDRDEEITRYG